MKKALAKILSIALVSCSLLAIPVSAEWRQDSNGWWYTEGNSWATGWRYINGDWYYFKSDGYMLNSPYCEFNNKVGSYVGAKFLFYNGEVYYFDKDGHMLHDCFVVEGSGCYQSWINSNGSLSDKVYGNKYNNNYDLSQAR